MLKSYFCLIFNFFVLPLIAQSKLNITGFTSVFKDSSIIKLSRLYPYKSIIEFPMVEKTVIIKDGQFKITLANSFAELYIFSIKERDSAEKIIRVFFESGDAVIHLNDRGLKKIQIEKNQAAQDYKNFLNKYSLITAPKLYREIENQLNDTKNTVEFRQMLLNQMDSIETDITKRRGELAAYYIKTNKVSKLNSYLVLQYLKKQIGENTLKTIFYKLPENTRKNSWGKELDYFFKRLTVGKKLPDFNLIDTSGIYMSLESFRGKYILLEFWASWCIPCRDKIPLLIKTNEKFASKNFEIVNISLDKNKIAWLKAINKEKIPGIHVSNLTKFNKQIDIEYGISSIPFNILIDSIGIIVAKNVWGPALDGILEKSVK